MYGPDFETVSSSDRAEFDRAKNILIGKLGLSGSDDVARAIEKPSGRSIAPSPTAC